MSEEKKGIKETKEVLDFLDGVLDDAIEAKSDDGKVSGFEAVRIALENAPEGVKAWNGWSEIDDEMKDLDDAETAELATRGVGLARRIMELMKAQS